MRHPRYHQRSILFCALVVAAILVSGCASKRTLPPPEGEGYRLPWGAVDIEAWEVSREAIFSEETRESWRKFAADYRQRNPGAKIPYYMLALSGGGSRGAFGAGILSGWTAAGNRPEFDVVTGISTGALMATPAFLGPNYDQALTLFTRISNEDVYSINGKLAVFNKSSLFDTTPLRELISTHIDKAMIDAVAREYRDGRTLFIGTTNLDARVFTIWDMGKIASSDLPSRYQLYRDVILASASFPIAFPPVELPIKTETGEVYYQLHADGGLKENVFLYTFLGELEEIIATFGLDWDHDIDPQVFLIYNGKIFEDYTYLALDPDTLSIATRSLFTLVRTSAASSIFQVWTMALGQGATINLAYIPEDYGMFPAVLDFDLEKMNLLYELGYKKSIQNAAWLRREPPENLSEFRDALKIIKGLKPIIPNARTGLEGTGTISTDE